MNYCIEFFSGKQSEVIIASYIYTVVHWFGPGRV